ncbi:MAG: hypothetical protein R3338_14475, partial [Thermoanaerobaculia bacterium]|nr:hypothetical protein [Thermoanaerobaculia bacterium]
MVTKEIPSSEWDSFLESFTMRHDGWLVDVEQVQDGQSRKEASSEPLEGIVPRTAIDEPRRIVVTIGGSTEAHRRITVEDPRSVRVDIDDGVERGKEQLTYRLRPLGQSLGLTNAELARQLRGAFFGVEALRQ